MPLLPVAEREVREASRQWRTYAWRSAIALIGLAVLAFQFWVDRSSRIRGQGLFITVSTIAFIYCLLGGVARTADILAEEKRENTLGLLFLTDLKSWQIILGKLLSSSVNCLCGLVALMPMLAIPMLIGGVQGMDFLRVALSLFNALFLSISWGFLISSLFRASVVTIPLALAVILLQAGGLPILAAVVDDEFRRKELAAWIFAFSPTHSHIFAFASGGPGALNRYWPSLLINHLIAWVNMALAMYFLPRFWQEVPKSKKTEKWRQRFRALRFGSGKAKKKLRTRLLNQNPLFWLANREQVSSAGLMMSSVLILAIAIGLGVATNGPADYEDIMICWMVGLGLVHVVVAFRMAMSASYRLSEDRRSGALELLLATEVSIKELLRGYWLGLGRQFFGPALILVCGGFFSLAMLLTMFADDLRTRGLFETLFEVLARLARRGADRELGLGFLVAVSVQVMLFLNWIALIWVGMWLGLREKRAGLATWTALALVYIPPWVLLIAGVATAEETNFFNLIPNHVTISLTLGAAWFLGLSNVLLLIWWARRNLLTRFREAAADRFSSARRISWPKVRRVAIRLAAAGACLLIAVYAWLYFMNRRGEKAWAAAQARFPNWNSQLSAALPSNLPPARLNLAEAPGMSFLLSGAQPNLITWNLVARPGQYNGEPLHWDWAERRAVNLARIEQIYLERRLLTATGETPALSVLAGLARYDAVLAQLHQEAQARPFFRLSASAQKDPRPHYYGWYGGWALADPHFTLRQLIQTLSLRASARVAAGSNAAPDLFLALRLTEPFRHQPIRKGQLHEALLDVAQPIYDGLSAGIWTDDELVKIQQYFTGLDLWSDFGQFWKESIRHTLIEADRILGPGNDRNSGPNWILATGFSRQWQADMLEWAMTKAPPVVDEKTRRINAEAFRQFQASRPKPPSRHGSPDFISATFRALGFAQTTADQIALACALERFRRAQGRYPNKLEELVPEWIEKVPHDVFNGEPLNYRLGPGGNKYQMYSVGPDGEDNNGQRINVSGGWMFWQEMTGFDWVWDSQPVDPPPTRRARR